MILIFGITITKAQPTDKVLDKPQTSRIHLIFYDKK